MMLALHRPAEQRDAAAEEQNVASSPPPQLLFPARVHQDAAAVTTAAPRPYSALHHLRHMQPHPLLLLPLEQTDAEERERSAASAAAAALPFPHLSALSATSTAALRAHPGADADSVVPSLLPALRADAQAHLLDSSVFRCQPPGAGAASRSALDTEVDTHNRSTIFGALQHQSGRFRRNNHTRTHSRTAPRARDRKHCLPVPKRNANV